MFKKICILSMLLIGVSVFSQNLKCKKFKTGTFIIPGDSIVPTSTLKRNGKEQIESLKDNDDMILDINWVDDCNYVLKISSKVDPSKIGKIEKMIDDNGGLKIEMLKTLKDTLYFRAKATINGNEYPIDGIQIKASEDY